jgi:catechol 2,3-dioxygenase-like lactoylglutathione lyase family enzyme
MTSMTTERSGSPRLSTAVMFVHDLDAAVAFYAELLMMDVTVKEPSAALLVNASSVQLYLREMGPRTVRALGSIGVQYVIWTASDVDDLRRCRRFLDERSARVLETTVGDITFIEGRDPSGAPVVVTFPGPDQAARHAIMKRVYTW